MNLIPVVFAASLAGSGNPERAESIFCEYKQNNAPFLNLKIGRFPDGDVTGSATVTRYGSAHKEPIFSVPRADVEWLHAWISHGTNDEIELVIFKSNRDDKDSTIVLQRAPGKPKLHGPCRSVIVRSDRQRR